MTVKELRAALFYLDDNLEVYISRDEEGNGFKSLYSVEVENVYNNSYTEDIEVVHKDDVEDYDPEYLKDGVVLWP